SLFNYIDLAASLFPVIGCFMFLSNIPGKIQDDTGIDGGPSQIWPMGFGILALYLNIVFKMRIITPLGEVVDIIITITRKILWFFLVFAVFLVSFTHAFLYVLHTRRYRPCEGDSCKNTDSSSSYPTGFLEALMVTYFFLSGRYDPVEASIDSGTVTFRVMMVIFFFFTVIILLNVLIALVNVAFNESGVNYQNSYWKVVAEVITGMDLIMNFGERFESGSQPEYIYYCASDEDIRKFERRSGISYLAESTQAADNETHSAQRMIIRSLSEMQRNHEQANGAFKNDLEALKELVEKLVALTEG
ncbi:hypothetical protein BGX34_005201, partial [Mortierella sp. NVP85]